MSNDCTYRSQIDAYYDGEMSPELARQFAEHLATCEDCRRDLGALQQMSTLFADSSDEGISLAVIGRIHERVDSEPPGTYFRTARLLIGLAASVLIIGAVWLYDMPAELTSIGPGASGIASKSSEPWEPIALGQFNVPPNAGLQSPMEDTRYVQAQAEVIRLMVRNLNGGSAHANP